MITIVDISVQTPASLVTVRDKVWFVARALEINPIQSSRMASACSQLCRELLEAGIYTNLRLSLFNRSGWQHFSASAYASLNDREDFQVQFRYAGLVDEVIPGEGQITLIKRLVGHDRNENSCAKIREDMHRHVMPTRAELELLATHDGLTHLFNRRSIEDKYTFELQRSTRYDLPFSVMLLDVDHFKKTNDLYGHRGGDACLIALSERLRESCREQDFAGRYGGEEFLILLTHTRGQDAAIVAERLRRRVEAMSIQHDAHTIQCTISIGIACHDANTETNSGSNLLEQADQAMYKAKNNGRNQVYIYQA